jgi:uncharacterized protein (DUF58 family)
MKEILSRLRKYEIQIRKAVDSHMHGNFKSVFKGTGLMFEDVRAYQYGDDIRTIDWNVSAKGHGLYVKIFTEEKEQTVFFLLDVSASQQIGQAGRQKMDLAKEICGVLALSVINQSGQVGLICYSDRKEKYLRPGKGLKHAYQFLSNLFDLQPLSRLTDLESSIHYALNRIKRRSVVVLVSDFLDEPYERSLIALAKKHDLVVLLLSDSREQKLPNLGIIPVLEQESQRTVWVNTASAAFRKKMAEDYRQRHEHLEKFCRRHNANYLSVSTEDDFIPKLVRLFRVRSLKN